VLQLGGALYQQIASAAAAPVEQSRFAGRTDVDAVKQEYRQDPRVRVLMDIGGGDAGPGALEPTWEMDFDSWPPSDVEPTAFYLGADGTLTNGAPTAGGEDEYTPDASARNQTSLPQGDAWAAQPPYQWEPVAGDHGLGYVTEPFPNDFVIAGPATMDLYVKSTAADTDLQVTLSEVRPDGEESYVQFGVLRASYRAPDKDSGDLEVVPTYLGADRADLPADEFTLVRVPIFPVA
jgi:predicted acyl esterase